jgi:hypothetical protein
LLLEILAAVNRLHEAIIGKEKEKQGSRLSSNELNCFKRVEISTAVMLKSSSYFDRVKAIIKRHTESLLILFRAGQVGEDVVQSNSLAMLNDLYGLLNTQFRVLNKTSGSSEIKYQTVLMDGICQHIANVNGETDEVLLFRNVCVHYFEDKALKENLMSAKHLAEAFVELKGFAEAFKSACGIEAPRFWGIMRNGVDWLFLRRRFANGISTYLQTTPFKIVEVPTSQSSNSSASAFDEANLDIVTTFVCNILTDVEKLTSIINQVVRDDASSVSDEVSDHEDDVDRDDK